MICNNKSDFLGGLSAELSKYGISGQQEILQDFEQHFSDGAAAGETEQQVCEKLGDPAEIAKQYIPDAEFTEIPAAAGQTGSPDTRLPAPMPAPGEAPPPPPPPVQPQYQQAQGFSPSASSVVGLILVDLFVFSWALPALMSLVAGFYGVTVGFGVGGLGIIVGGIVMNFVNAASWFVSCFSPISTVLLGMFMVSASVLLVLLSIKMTIGFINIILRVVNWHSRTFAGKNVVTLLGKKYRKESAAA